MKRKTVLFIFTFLSYTILFAQMGTLTGTVYNDGKPLGYTSITILELKRTTVANDKGVYTFTDVPEGNYTVKANMMSFKSVVATVNVLEKKTTQQDFELIDDLLRLEEVVITGTRNEVATYNSPVIVSTIDNRIFEATQSLSIAEGLNFSPGLRIENNCQNCGFTQLRMNGLDGPYSQILINSRPIFSALAGVYGLEMLPANMVDRVEVVRGGGSALYGGSAIGGTVNIITKDPIQNSFEIGMNQAFTNMDTPDRTISFNGAIVNDELDKGISFYAYNRDRKPWDANDDGFSEITQLENNTFGFDAFWNTTERSKIKLNMYSIREFRRGGNKFDLAPHQSDLTEQLDHKILGGSISFEQYSKDYKHKIAIYTSTQQTHRNSYYGAGGRVLSENDTITSDDVLAINAYGNSKDISLVTGIQYAYEISKKTHLTAGSEYQFNDVIDEMPGYGRTIDQQVGTLGTYAQFELKPTERLSFLVGGRFDRLNIKGRYDLAEEAFNDQKTLNVAVPRFTTMYKLNDNLKARASFAQGYRGPQAFDEDLHIETVGGAAVFTRLDENLTTERSNSFTASLNQTKIIGKIQSSIVLEGFYTELQNPFITANQTALPSGIAVVTKRNGEAAVVSGINLEVNLAFSKKLILQSGATLQRARYKVEEEIWTPEELTSANADSVVTTNNILRTPNVYGFYTLVYKPTEAIAISYSGLYTGKMDVAHVIDPETEYTVVKTTPVFLENNLKIAYTFHIHQKNNYDIELFAGIHNIFNSYQNDFDIGMQRDAGYVYGPMKPRTIFMGVKMKFN